MTQPGKIYVVANKGTVYINKEAVTEMAKLDKLAKETNNVIYQISSVFPFQIFPDKIIIDENKVTIVRKELFFKRTIPIMYKDVLNVKINRGILFAAMEIAVMRSHPGPRPILYLHPKEATLAKKYILGLMETKKANIDISKLTKEQVREKLEKIGRASDETEDLF